jgi:hypothetical protein
LTQKVFSGGDFSPSIFAFGGIKDAGICPARRKGGAEWRKPRADTIVLAERIP